MDKYFNTYLTKYNIVSICYYVFCYTIIAKSSFWMIKQYRNTSWHIRVFPNCRMIVCIRVLCAIHYPDKHA